jgi:hypothetical protein
MNKKNPTPAETRESLLRSRVNRLQEHRSELAKQLASVEAQRDQSQQERLALREQLAALQERRETIYTIERVMRGDQVVGLVRTAGRIEGYQLLGLLTVAVDEVKAQLSQKGNIQRVIVQEKKG